MRPVLEGALEHHETRYYNVMAERLGVQSTLTLTQILPACEKAQCDNVDVVEKKAGFR